MRRWILRALAAVAVIFGGVWLIGALLPERHVAATRAVYEQPPDTLWTAITDVAAHPAWRPDIDSVAVLSERPLRWREAGASGSLAYRAETVARPFRFVARIDDPSQPFGGRWIWRIEPTPAGGAVVSITEEGEIYSPLFRFFARFVFGYHSTQERYLRALGQRFGDETTVERVDPPAAATEEQPR